MEADGDDGHNEQVVDQVDEELTTEITKNTQRRQDPGSAQIKAVLVFNPRSLVSSSVISVVNPACSKAKNRSSRADCADTPRMACADSLRGEVTVVRLGGGLSRAVLMKTLAALAILAVAGCGPRATKPGGDAQKAPDASLSALLRSNQPATIDAAPMPKRELSSDDQAVWNRPAAVNLEQALAAAENAPPRPPEPVKAIEVPESPNFGLAAVAGDAGVTAGSADDQASNAQAAQKSETKPTPPEPEAKPVSPIVDLARKMAALLRQKDDAGKPLISDTAALTPLAALASKSNALATIEQATDPKHPLHDLSEADRKVIAEARARVLANPRLATEDLINALRANQQAGPSVTITKAALCTRVEGFGRFEAFPSSTFVAGQPIRAIVYTQLADFAARPARDNDPVQRTIPIGEQVSVDLAQELSLFTDADGLLAWHDPGRGVVETNRTKRTDFYLVQMIELPATLSIGRYNLKVTVTDRTTGAQAERVLPIEVVADARLVR